MKIDGTGDLLRAYQNKECDEFFKNHPTTPEQSLRKWDIVAREELGPDVYVLACHTVGNARNVIGLVDGARLSNDGFQPRTLAQYNFLEGVVWRNDPDHCDVLGEWLMDTDAMMPVFGTKEPVPARTVIRPAICAMAGGVLMLSDKVEVYQDDRNIEGMKRSAPVLFTVPGQLYSCGRNTVPWWLQEIDRPFDHWSVLARIQWGEKRETEWVFDFKGVPQQEVKFADLGLHDDREYLVFEFWTQKFLGKFKGSFTAPAMDENNGMQVFAIREAREHPVGPLDHPAHLAGRRQPARREMGRGDENPLRQERRGRRRSLRADGPSAGRLSAGAGQSGRPGGGNRPWRTDGRASNRTEDDGHRRLVAAVHQVSPAPGAPVRDADAKRYHTDAQRHNEMLALAEVRGPIP